MQRISVASSIAWQLGGIEVIQILRQNKIEKEHIFLGILKLLDILQDEIVTKLGIPKETAQYASGEIQIMKHIFCNLGINTQDLRWKFRSYLEVGGTIIKEPIIHRSPECRKMFENADILRQRYGHNEISLNHLVYTLFSEENNKVIDFLNIQNINVNALRERLSESLEKAESYIQPTMPQESPSQQILQSYVSKIGRDLTELAKKGKLGMVIGRDAEIKSIAQTLARKKKNSAIIIGDPGVGKTAAVEGLAQKIVNEELTGEELKGLKIIEVRMGEIMAGAKFRGDLEERLMTLLKEAQRDPKLVVFLDEIHTVMQASGEHGGGVGVADILKPALQSGEFRCIGATTFREYKKYIESDPALQRRFQPIIINEPSRDDALKILLGLKSSYEEHHGLRISEEAIKAAVDMSIRYLADMYLPDKALDLLDEAASMLRIHSVDSKRQYTKTLELPFIAEAVSKRKGIPLQVLLCKEEDRLKDLKEKLERKIIGQPEAIQTVTNAVTKAKVLGGEKNKPSGIFLFAGATGTGKTEMAKVLADFLFEGAEGKLLPFDMSEYMEEYSVSKLIGAPPGYVGHEAGGQLVEQVKRHPYSVVLFDEIEKAHPKVFDVFLQIFDEARLTDGAGRRADFQNAFIVLTSNIGSKIQVKGVGKPIGIQLPEEQEEPKKKFALVDKTSYRNKILDAIQNGFRPEFLSRIPPEHIIVFYPLDPKALEKILRDILVPSLEPRFSAKKVTLEITDDVVQYLLKKIDITYGVRNLIQLLDNEITSPLTKALIDRIFDEGTKVVIRVKENKLFFEKC